jgi:hypothetical protein
MKFLYSNKHEGTIFITKQASVIKNITSIVREMVLGVKGV